MKRTTCFERTAVPGLMAILSLVSPLGLGCSSSRSLAGLVDSIAAAEDWPPDQELIERTNSLARELACELGEKHHDSILAEAAAASLGVIITGRDEDHARLEAVADRFESEGCGEADVYPRVALLVSHAYLAVDNKKRAGALVERVCGQGVCGAADQRSELALECLDATATVAHAEGNYASEQALREKQLALVRGRFGGDSRHAADVLADLAVAASAAGRFEAAQEKIVELERSSAGRWPDLLQSALAGLADSAAERDELCIGEKAVERATKMLAHQADGCSSTCRRLLSSTSRFYTAQGRYAEALAATTRLRDTLGTQAGSEIRREELELVSGYLSWQNGEDDRMASILRGFLVDPHGQESQNSAPDGRFGSRVWAMVGRGYLLLGDAVMAGECFRRAALGALDAPVARGSVLDLLLEAAWLSWIRDRTIAWARPMIEAILEVGSSQKTWFPEGLVTEAKLLLEVDRFGTEDDAGCVAKVLDAVRATRSLVDAPMARSEYVGYAVFLVVKILGAKATHEASLAARWFERSRGNAARASREYKATHCLHRLPRERCHIQKAFSAVARGKYIEDGRTDLADRWGAVHAAMECR